MKRYYFDYAATTPVDPDVVAAMTPYQTDVFANPGALHQDGQKASAAVFAARRSAAKLLGTTYESIIYTGSATEANNMVLRSIGKGFAYQQEEKHIIGKAKKPRIVISAIEHASVSQTAHDLAHLGIDVVVVPVNKEGRVQMKKLEAALTKETLLVSIMYANNEVGTVQAIKKIATRIKAHRKEGPYPLFHTDAVQAFQYLPCNVDDLGVDLMTLSAHKIYGPKGIGLLYARTPELMEPIITGGGQEMGLRSGTENTANIVGFARAMEIAAKKRSKESLRMQKLQAYCMALLKKEIPGLRINGSTKYRIPNNINIYIPGTTSEALIVELDLRGCAVSTGAACSARATTVSPVLRALGHNNERSKNSLRITFGRGTKKADITRLVTELKKITA